MAFTISVAKIGENICSDENYSDYNDFHLQDQNEFISFSCALILQLLVRLCACMCALMNYDFKSIVSCFFECAIATALIKRKNPVAMPYNEE